MVNSHADCSTTGLRVENLRKSYDDTVAVDGISFEVGRGSIYGMIGPDGAGKTTTMRIVCGLLLPDSGTCNVLGFDPERQVRDVREHIGYMPQRFSLYPDLTVDENLRFFADMYKVSKTDFERRLPRLFEFSRLGDFRKRKAGALSGGMKQKLALICTLIHTPELLVLDEPTFGVDPVSRQEFWAILRDLADDGLALFVSTAYMDEAQLCDRLALMHHGKMIAQGRPDEIADHFTHRLLEIVTGDPVGVRNALRPLSETGIGTHRFGDRLHVVYDTPEQEAAIHDVLAGHEVSFESIPPSVEDTFVALLQEQDEEAA